HYNSFYQTHLHGLGRKHSRPKLHGIPAATSGAASSSLGSAAPSSTLVRKESSWKLSHIPATFTTISGNQRQQQQASSSKENEAVLGNEKIRAAHVQGKASMEWKSMKKEGER
ncbi:hypothetical protein VIGAN_UM167000, partial [Vigna angularis var. angularis]